MLFLVFHSAHEIQRLGLEKGNVNIFQIRVFWVVTPCGYCKNRRFGGTGASFIRVTKIGELGTTQAAASNRRTLRRNTRNVGSYKSHTA
jgi:hypothetical protein